MREGLKAEFGGDDVLYQFSRRGIVFSDWRSSMKVSGGSGRSFMYFSGTRTRIYGSTCFAASPAA
jgi:hypothetical protein